MRVDKFRLLKDPHFVGGLIAGLGVGGLLGYSLGWEHSLGLGPGLMSLPCIVLVVGGVVVPEPASQTCWVLLGFGLGLFTVVTGRTSWH